MTRMKKAILVQALWMFMLTASLAVAQVQTPAISPAPPETPAGASVVFSGETLFTVYNKIDSFSSPQERATAINERLALLAENPLFRPDTIAVQEGERTSDIVSGDLVIISVTDEDASPIGRSRQEVAQAYARTIRHALTTSLEQTTVRSILIDGAYALLITVIYIAFLIAFLKLFPRLYEKILALRGTYIPPIKIQRVELLSANQIALGITALARGLRFVATLALGYVWVTAVLGVFHWTRGISAQLLGVVLKTLNAIGLAFVTFVPNVISIVIIIFVTRYIIKLIALVFTGMERGAISFKEFRREWTRPTFKIVRFLVIVFAAIAIFPYIPGSQSDAFRGVSVFLGVLLSFGSAGAISNIIAGVVLTYMHPFREGDRVKIADTTGDIMERTLLVTRIRTIKNVDISIPNSIVLSSHLINFSSCAQKEGLILHTSVTIGYDAPWKTVHELLIAAAKMTTHILKTPEPFVLQTSLDDFYVTYEINAYTDQANKMATIYAELHQNIQDKFNEAGVEIMSPHYGQFRDGNQTTIPEQYLPKNYQAPAFRIGPLGNLFGGAKDAGTGKGEPGP
ncbi:MAG: mechanosensitive ion channel [Nitrospirota bacterium]|nr:mechanosensitive ion channel [Nitrospirota bacterium]